MTSITPHGVDSCYLKPGSNPFLHPFRAKFQDGRGGSLSCSYNLWQLQGPAHITIAVQTSQSSEAMQRAAARVTTIYNSMSPNDDLILVAFDSTMRFHSNIYTSTHTLQEVLSYMAATDCKEACLWQTVTHACNLFLEWQHEFQQHNCFLHIDASGSDTCQGDVNICIETFNSTRQSLPFLEVLLTAPAGTPLHNIFSNGINRNLKEAVSNPGQYCVGQGYFVAKGADDTQSESVITTRDRDVEQVADKMRSITPHVAKGLKAEQLLPGWWCKTLGITWL